VLRMLLAMLRDLLARIFGGRDANEASKPLNRP